MKVISNRHHRHGKIHISIFLILISLRSSGQRVVVDSDFGKYLNLNFKSSNKPKLFYDKADSSVLISYILNENDGFSHGLFYVRFGVCKIDLSSGKYDKNFGIGGVSEISQNVNLSNYKNIRSQKSNQEYLFVNRNQTPSQILVVNGSDGNQEQSLVFDSISSTKFVSPLYIDQSRDRVLLYTGSRLVWCLRNGTTKVVTIPTLAMQELDGFTIEKIFESRNAVCLKLQVEEYTSYGKVSSRQRVLLYDGTWSVLGEKFEENSSLDWVAIYSTLQKYNTENIEFNIYIDQSREWGDGLDFHFYDYEFSFRDQQDIYIISTSTTKIVEVEGAKDVKFFAVDETPQHILRKNFETHRLDTFMLKDLFPENFEIKSLAHSCDQAINAI